MARITDKNKLESIKIKFVALIVENGISNTTISKVAKAANVSAGYLYRHYDSKESLLLDVYRDKFNEINDILSLAINAKENFKDFVLDFYMRLIKLAQDNENDILFLLKMMTDYSIKFSEEIKDELISSIYSLKEKFNRDINRDIKNEQLFIQILGTFLIFINLRKRKLLSDKAITNDDIKQLTKITVNSLK